MHYYNNYSMTYLIPGLIGLLSASLINYLSDVLPASSGFTHPICSHCGEKRSWLHFLTLLPCPQCATRRSTRSFIVLLASPAAAILIFLFPPARMDAWLGILVLTYLAVVAVIDLEHHLILHKVSLAGAILGVIVGSIRYALFISLAGGLAGFIVMLFFYWVGSLFARYRAKKMGTDDGEEALGFGDVTISAVLGLMLGWPVILYGLTIAILAGGFFSLLIILFLMATRRYQSMSVFTAYGPYLVFGAILLMYFPPYLAYLTGK